MEHAEDNDYGVLSLASSSAFSDRAASISSTANVTPARLTATSTAGEAIEIDSAARQQQQSRMDGITSLVNSRYDGVDTHEHYSPEDSRHEYSHAMSRGQGSSDDSTLSGGGSFQPTSPSTARGGAAGGGGADSVLATPVLERAQLSLGPTAFYGDIQLGDQVSASLEHQWRDAVDRGRGTFEHHRQGSDGGASDGSPQRRQHDDLDVSHDGSQRHQRTSRGRALMLGSTASSYVFASAAQSVHQLAGQPAPEHAALRMSSPPASPTTSASDNMTGDESAASSIEHSHRQRAHHQRRQLRSRETSAAPQQDHPLRHVLDDNESFELMTDMDDDDADDDDLRSSTFTTDEDEDDDALEPDDLDVDLAGRLRRRARRRRTDTNSGGVSGARSREDSAQDVGQLLVMPRLRLPSHTNNPEGSDDTSPSRAEDSSEQGSVPRGAVATADRSSQDKPARPNVLLAARQRHSTQREMPRCARATPQTRSSDSCGDARTPATSNSSAPKESSTSQRRNNVVDASKMLSPTMAPRSQLLILGKTARERTNFARLVAGSAAPVPLGSANKPGSSSSLESCAPATAPEGDPARRSSRGRPQDWAGEQGNKPQTKRTPPLESASATSGGLLAALPYSTRQFTFVHPAPPTPPPFGGGSTLEEDEEIAAMAAADEHAHAREIAALITRAHAELESLLNPQCDRKHDLAGFLESHWQTSISACFMIFSSPPTQCELADARAISQVVPLIAVLQLPPTPLGAKRPQKTYALADAVADQFQSAGVDATPVNALADGSWPHRYVVVPHEELVARPAPLLASKLGNEAARSGSSISSFASTGSDARDLSPHSAWSSGMSSLESSQELLPPPAMEEPAASNEQWPVRPELRLLQLFGAARISPQRTVSAAVNRFLEWREVEITARASVPPLASPSTTELPSLRGGAPRVPLTLDFSRRVSERKAALLAQRANEERVARDGGLGIAANARDDDRDMAFYRQHLSFEDIARAQAAKESAPADVAIDLGDERPSTFPGTLDPLSGRGLLHLIGLNLRISLAPLLPRSWAPSLAKTSAFPKAAESWVGGVALCAVFLAGIACGATTMGARLALSVFGGTRS